MPSKSIANDFNFPRIKVDIPKLWYASQEISDQILLGQKLPFQCSRKFVYFPQMLFDDFTWRHFETLWVDGEGMD